MRTLTLSALGASSLLAVGLMMAGPACARSADQVAGRSQSLLVASEGDGSGADVRANGRWVAMAAPDSPMLAARAQAILVASEGSGADVGANARWVA